MAQNRAGAPPGGPQSRIGKAQYPASALPAALPPRGAAAAEREWDYADDEPSRERSSSGLYIGVGALVALVAVIVALLAFSPGSDDIPTSGTAETTEPAQQTTRAPATRNPVPGGTPTTSKATPPPATTASPQPTTPPTTPPPTTTVPVPTVPIDPGPGDGNVNSPEDVTNPDAAP